MTKTTSQMIYKHVCFHEKEIMEMHKILVGNGEPEKSLCRQVALIAERQENIMDYLKESKERRKATPYMVIKIIGIICAITMVYFGYHNLIKGQKNIQNKTQSTNDVLIPSTRGSIYVPFAVDTTEKVRYLDTVDVDGIIKKIK